MELEAARSDGDLPGLAYLETARGINLILQKLPYNSQEKWLAHGSRFKEEYKVPFPPFGYFVDFVCQQAKMQNDPSFSIQPTCPSTVDRDLQSQLTRLRWQTTPSLQWAPRGKVKRIELNIESIEHRKALLKQHGICYKCCASSAHLARNSDNNTKCLESRSGLRRPTPLIETMAGRKSIKAKERLFLQPVLRSVEETSLRNLVQRFVLLRSIQLASRRKRTGYAQIATS